MLNFIKVGTLILGAATGVIGVEKFLSKPLTVQLAASRADNLEMQRVLSEAIDVAKIMEQENNDQKSQILDLQSQLKALVDQSSQFTQRTQATRELLATSNDENELIIRQSTAIMEQMQRQRDTHQREFLNTNLVNLLLMCQLRHNMLEHISARDQELLYLYGQISANTDAVTTVVARHGRQPDQIRYDSNKFGVINPPKPTLRVRAKSTIVSRDGVQEIN